MCMYLRAFKLGIFRARYLSLIKIPLMENIDSFLYQLFFAVKEMDQNIFEVFFKRWSVKYFNNNCYDNKIIRYNLLIWNQKLSRFFQKGRFSTISC